MLEDPAEEDRCRSYQPRPVWSNPQFLNDLAWLGRHDVT